MRVLLNHCHLIIDGNKECLDGAILLNDEYIEEVFPHTNKLTIKDTDYEEINLDGAIVMPGFFDTHLHGSNGYSLEEIDKLNLDEISKSLALHGTTSFLATTSAHINKLDTLEKLNDLKTSASKCLGIHIEGPFLSKEKLGAATLDQLLEPKKEYLDEFIKLNPYIKQMTLAIELEGIDEVINSLKENNIKVMVGHSNAKEKDLVNKYYDGFTHFYNAMSGFNHHELGLVNMGFNNPDKYIELIADGIHVDESVLKVTLNNFRRDRIMLISDAIHAAGLQDGEYNYNGSVCIKNGKRFSRKADDILSGSASFILDEIKVLKKLGASYTDLLLMSSLNAYRFYGLDNLYGSLYKGKYSDIVVLDDNLDLKMVYVRGKRYA